MSTWCTPEQAGRSLPEGYATLLTSKGTSIEDLITEASDECESALSPRYWPFPDVDGDAPFVTPTIVQVAVSYLAQHKANEVIGAYNNVDFDDNTNLVSPYSHYLQRVNGLMMDTDGPFRLQIPTVSVTEEADFSESDDYELSPSVPGGYDIIDESVEITGFSYGDDFEVNFSKELRGWVVTRLTDDIADDASVTYSLSYLRQREVDKPARRRGGVLILG